MSCEDVLDCLLIKIQQEDRIRLLWSLLEDRDQDNKALYILLVKIGQLAPNIPKHVLKDLLDKQAITTNILLKVKKNKKDGKKTWNLWIKSLELQSFRD